MSLLPESVSVDCGPSDPSEKSDPDDRTGSRSGHLATREWPSVAGRELDDLLGKHSYGRIMSASVSTEHFMSHHRL